MIHIAFKTPGDSLISKCIAAEGEPKRFCHAAIFFGVDPIHPWMICESHADTDGVRFQNYTPDPNRWVTFPVGNLNDGDEEAARRWCELQAGCGYDFCGGASKKISLFREDPCKFICSELCLALLQHLGSFRDCKAHQYWPNDLFLLLTEGKRL